MRACNYTFNYKPAIYDYIMRDLCLNERNQEKKILELIVKGYTCNEIGQQLGYSERTIKRRRKDIYEKTKDLMI